MRFSRQAASFQPRLFSGSLSKTVLPNPLLLWYIICIPLRGKKDRADGEKGMTRYEYGNPASSRVLIQMVDDHDLSGMEREVNAIRDQAGDDFFLVALKVEDWNRDLSPWKAPAVFGNKGFGGGAEKTLSLVRSEMADPEKKYYIGGYSLSGLFALWAAFQAEGFAGVAAASPSVWFPGFVEYMAGHPVHAGKVYLSLGDREEKTGNPVMASVGDRIRAGYEILRGKGIPCVLEWNKGGHFRDADLRTAAAFAWVLKAADEEVSPAPEIPKESGNADPEKQWIRIGIRRVGQDKKRYLPLLLLADEQEDMIDRYLERGTMYVLEDGGVTIAECVVTDEGNGILEIKSLAVAPAYQGKGFGRSMIRFVAEQYRDRYTVLQVGTGDSPLTVPFYESCGFVRHHVEKDFFTDNYDHPIFEAGHQLKDMIYLRMPL